MVAPMSRESLTIYLNDHLAGSVAALELLDHMIRLEQGKPREGPLARIRSEVEEDQKTLQALLQGIGGKESRVRQAAAWLTEKLGRAKLLLDAAESGELQVLESLEALALGIQGKAGLWRALAATSMTVNRLDYAGLEQRALKQFQTVDGLRLEAARAALSL
jgi:hypothetical protein